ncbi:MULTISPECIES: LPXTG cell wall anchor domain-containing protein [unclassified Enterococcus]|uniref:LPXTG cell wall anchor domain-containing protein n=1 Tax=unclassified Enterococcus TaxID=2608891 RepID=UPI001A9C1485|nr:LPXTG cell wall anchor domain-containing protein [Enterococcus sp. DIV1271a]MBO1300579.1 LPXTG cell wall anchor domain-containing protein [Enterococcus sp. DIV1271a]
MSTTTIELNGMLGVTEQAPTPKEETPSPETNSTIRSEVKVVHPLPKTNDQTGMYLSLLGFVLILLACFIWAISRNLKDHKLIN